MTSAQHIRNLLTFYDQASPQSREEALQSYPHYNMLLARIAADTYLPLDRVVAVFAALSPNNDYVGNLRDCRSLCQAVARGSDIDSFRVSTYHPNKRKAWAIATGVDTPDQAIRARKTLNFYHNCLDPRDPEWVTVDGHMYWAWHGTCGRVKSRDHEQAANVNNKIYTEIADGLRLVADLRGVIPCEAQAVIWQAYRRKFNKVRAAQMEWLPSDLIAVGLINLGKVLS